MILFLDFDGVLHPETTDREDALFCCRSHLWAVLDAMPAVEVVITSTWLHKHPFEDLVTLVTAGGGEHLAGRFVGATPDIFSAPGGTYRSREMECMAWLSSNIQSSRKWIAVDDVASGFLFPQPLLVLIDPATGLTGDDVNRIVGRSLCDQQDCERLRLAEHSKGKRPRIFYDTSTSGPVGCGSEGTKP